MIDYKPHVDWNGLVTRTDYQPREVGQQSLFWPTVIWSVINVALWSQIVFIVIDRL